VSGLNGLKWVAAGLLLATSCMGCATRLDALETQKYSLSVEKTKAAAEDALFDQDWVVLRARSATQTEASFADGSGHVTQLTVKYKDLGDGKTLVSFVGQSDGPWFTLGIVGLSDRDKAKSQVDEAVIAIEEKARQEEEG